MLVFERGVDWMECRRTLFRWILMPTRMYISMAKETTNQIGM